MIVETQKKKKIQYVPERKITVNDGCVYGFSGSWEEDDTLTLDSGRWCQARTTRTGRLTWNRINKKQKKKTTTRHVCVIGY